MFFHLTKTRRIVLSLLPGVYINSTFGGMDAAKLYVGGLPFRYTEVDLRCLCEKYGDIADGMFNFYLALSRTSLTSNDLRV